MTLQEYYTKMDELQIPKGLDFPAKRNWFLQAKADLQKHLSKEDLETVLSAERKWSEKVKSSFS